MKYSTVKTLSECKKAIAQLKDTGMTGQEAFAYMAEENRVHILLESLRADDPNFHSGDVDVKLIKRVLSELL